MKTIENPATMLSNTQTAHDFPNCIVNGVAHYASIYKKTRQGRSKAHVTKPNMSDLFILRVESGCLLVKEELFHPAITEGLSPH